MESFLHRDSYAKSGGTHHDGFSYSRLAQRNDGEVENGRVVKLSLRKMGIGEEAPLSHPRLLVRDPGETFPSTSARVKFGGARLQ